MVALSVTVFDEHTVPEGADDATWCILPVCLDRPGDVRHGIDPPTAGRLRQS